MIKKVNKTEEIKAKLSLDKKVTYLNTPEQINAIIRMNEEMEEVRREFKLKEKKSQISASKVVLTS